MTVAGLQDYLCRVKRSEGLAAWVRLELSPRQQDAPLGSILDEPFPEDYVKDLLCEWGMPEELVAWKTVPCVEENAYFFGFRTGEMARRVALYVNNVDRENTPCARIAKAELMEGCPSGVVRKLSVLGHLPPNCA